MPSQDEIFTKVSATLVEALNVDEEEITPTSTLQGDLGAESIDLLDIIFRLEREFGIPIIAADLALYRAVLKILDLRPNTKLR